MAFLYPFILFLQPGILWPELAPFKPFLLASAVGAAVGLAKRNFSAEALKTQLSHPVFMWLVAFVFVQVISVSYGGFRAMAEELDFWANFPIFVAVSVILVRTPKSLGAFVAGMLCGSAVVIVYGIHAALTHSPALEGNRAGAYGMYKNHNDYTFIILMALPFAYMAIGVVKSRIGKLLLMLFVAACAVGVLMSLSRGGILALVLAFGLLYWKTTSGGRRIVGLGVLLAAGLMITAYQFAAREENQRGSYSEEDAKTSRFELWRAAGNMIKAHPLLGVGSRRFPEYSQQYAEISYDNRGKVAHNTYLDITATSGLLGLGTFAMMLLSIYRVGNDRRQTFGTVLPPNLYVAAWVGVLTIVFRALLNSKQHDWSFYFLATMAILIATLQRHEATASADEKLAAPGQALAPGRTAALSPPASRPAPAQRPMIYSRRARPRGPS